MCTAALAFVDVLLTDDEMATCNTSGTKGFHRLDSGKLGFLATVLHRKFDSPFFSLALATDIFKTIIHFVTLVNMSGLCNVVKWKQHDI